jgi:hypothetical protein
MAAEHALRFDVSDGDAKSSREAAMHHPATKKRGADPHVPAKPAHRTPKDAKERKLEQGLEESMAGSDPVSITQPRRHAKDDSGDGSPD